MSPSRFTLIAQKMAPIARLYRNEIAKPGAVALSPEEFNALCDVAAAAPALHAFAQDMVGYLEMKLTGFRHDYPEDHCIVQTCLRKLAAARHALGYRLDRDDLARVAAEYLTHTEQ